VASKDYHWIGNFSDTSATLKIVTNSK